MATRKMLLAGFGGQGVLLIGQMIAYSAMYEDKNVTWMPSYGPEMRGGTANCTVVVSDKPIASPLPSSYDTLLAMNTPSLHRYIDELQPGGDLFINSSIIHEKVERDDINVYYVDTVKLAHEVVGNEKTANMVMLGAIIKKTNVVEKATMGKTFAKLMTGKKAKLIEPNMKAIDAWEE
ncbi:MAG: 2-oxoacid:acceptor oxidoreductase family protein [Eubacterium sp.]|nr:2-oxoacid:acceptor oxidoreductase family protein [Candidatus Colimonas fimequi]